MVKEKSSSSQCLSKAFQTYPIGLGQLFFPSYGEKNKKSEKESPSAPFFPPYRFSFKKPRVLPLLTKVSWQKCSISLAASSLKEQMTLFASPSRVQATGSLAGLDLTVTTHQAAEPKNIYRTRNPSVYTGLMSNLSYCCSASFFEDSLLITGMGCPQHAPGS